MEEITYKKAGVDIDEGDRFVRLISPMVKKTFIPGVMTDIGSFGALFNLDLKKYKNPVLVSGTDGVGTKLKVAFMSKKHDTVGIDLVAMCVNDILTLGADPLFFLDYFATGKLSSDRAAEVIKGIAEGCKESGCALIGGETAEMPGFYDEGEYDLAGFAVGAVDKENIVDGSKIQDGDVIVGIESSGLHSNGYSLARKVFFDAAGYKIDTILPELGTTLGEELLKPTRIYVKAFNALRNSVTIKGMAHITGGGVIGNVPRILGDGLSAVIYENSWPIPHVFMLIKKLGNVPDEDMKKTFNLGVGYVIVVSKADMESAIAIAKNSGFSAYHIGAIKKGGSEKISYV
jgi:phosphoribosylformylglycinamidine cyclo-ligase